MSAIGRNASQRVLAHRRVAQTLEHEIVGDGKAGARLPAETALAERFGVSTLTIREAVACLVEKGLVERRQGSGTYILDPRATRHVGILLNLDLRAPGVGAFWVPVAEEFRRLMTTFGYRTRFYVGDHGPLEPAADNADGNEMLNDIEAGGVVGLLVLGQAPAAPIRQALAAHGAILIINGTLPGHQRAAHIAYEELVRLAFTGLAAQGCRRIGVLGWGIDPQQVAVITTECSIAWDPSLHVHAPHPLRPGAGYVAFQRLAAQATPLPDGLVVCDEQHLQGVVLGVLEAGVQVPDGLRLASHVNEGSRVFSPLPFGAVVVSPQAAAQNMARAFLAGLRGEGAGDAEWSAPLRWEDRPHGTPTDWRWELEKPGEEI